MRSAAEVSEHARVLLVDKPAGLTSHGVVARVRRLAGTRKVGHAGTLDPMATGLLILGVGSATRLLTYLVGADKEYLATVRLGASTTTDDAEVESTPCAHPDWVARLGEAEIAAGMAALTGTIDQVPSAVSAIKVHGERAYARVRAGERVDLAARRVTVAAFNLLEPPVRSQADGRPVIDLAVCVECSSGTYVRALARDLGKALGVGGHLTALRRTRVGPFRIAEATPLDGLDADRDALRPADAAARLFDTLPLDAGQADDLGHGRRIRVPGPDSIAPLAAIDASDRLVALAARQDGVVRVLTGFPVPPAQEVGS